MRDWELSRGGGSNTNEYFVALLDLGVIKTKRRKFAIEHNIISQDERVSKKHLKIYFQNHQDAVQIA